MRIRKVRSARLPVFPWIQADIRFVPRVPDALNMEWNLDATENRVCDQGHTGGKTGAFPPGRMSGAGVLREVIRDMKGLLVRWPDWPASGSGDLTPCARACAFPDPIFRSAGRPLPRTSTVGRHCLQLIPPKGEDTVEEVEAS